MQRDGRDMADMAVRFLGFQWEYYTGKSGDGELADMATQPFWQSMRLSKKRLEDRGLTMEMVVSEDASRHGAKRDGEVTPQKDGTDLIGESVRDVVTHRQFFREGKKIYEKKEHEISNVSLLKAEVEGEYAACPNCGHVGKISSYIDGCDACGSVFTVRDFETKISGFALEENTEKKTRATIRHTLIWLVVVSVLMLILGIIAMTVLGVRLVSGENNAGILPSVMGVLMALDLVPLGVRSILWLAVIYLFLGNLLFFLYRHQIQGESEVKTIIPKFSARDFYQNLEYKLRNIHLTDRAEEVRAFAVCPLEKAVSGYRDVVDCSLNRLHFKRAQKTGDGYTVDTAADMKLTCYDGKRIRMRYERLELTLHGKEEVVGKRTAAIREYKCPGCGGSINVLEGAVCPHCDSRFDYENYDWVIQSYQTRRRPFGVYVMIRTMIVAVYLLVFALHITGLKNEADDNWVNLYLQFQSEANWVEAVYDAIPMPDTLGMDVTLVSSSDIYIERKNTYTCEDSMTVAQAYLPVVEEAGFTLDETDTRTSSYVLYMYRDYDQDRIEIRMTVTWQGETLEVLIETSEQ